MKLRLRLWLLMALMSGAVAAFAGPASAPMGPLVASVENPRYFADPAGNVVFLAGSHTWNNLVDMDASSPPHPFDYDAYLDFLQTQNLNFIRLWTWETAKPDDERDTPRRKFAAPQAWLRTGPGVDRTGLPKFDLTKLDPSYFQRLTERVLAARARRMYVSIMLFDGWSVQFSPGKLSHPFFSGNNINSLPDIKDIRDIDTLLYPAITAVQERYVAEVLDTVGRFDNVLFEIVNEAGPYSTQWQAHMIDFVRTYEAAHGYLRHPVGMTAQHDPHNGGQNATLFASTADWIAPKPESGHYRTAPQPASGNKIIVADSDHLDGTAVNDSRWAWKSLFRGLNLLYMDRYFGRDAVGLPQEPVTAELRAALGCARLLADFIRIGHFKPALDIASSGYALVSSDAVLVYLPRAEAFDVDLRSLPGDLQLEWLDLEHFTVTSADPIKGGRTLVWGSHYEGGAILYLRLPHAATGSLRMIEERARSVRQASLRYLPLSVRMRIAAKDLVTDVSFDTTSAVLSLAVALFIGYLFGLLTLKAVRRLRLPSERA